MPIIKSIRELTNELLNIRVGAVSTSIWSIQSSLKDRAFVAIQDAIRTFPLRYEETLNSVYVTGSDVHIALPRDTVRVIDVHVVNASSGVKRIVDTFQLEPGASTCLLHVVDGTSNTDTKWISIRCEMQVADIPPIVYVGKAEASPDSLGWISGPSENTVYQLAEVQKYVELGRVLDQVHQWPGVGYVEAFQNTFGFANSIYAARVSEIMHFNSVTLTPGANPYTVDLSVDKRGLFGTAARTWRYGASKDTMVISMALISDGDYFSSLMAQAEANMYNFWLGHRAMYDQYSTLVGSQALSMEDLLTMVRTLEARAERRKDMHKEAPKPGRIQFRKRQDL